MQQRYPPLVGRQCLVEEAFDEPHAILNGLLGNPAVAQDAQHGLRRIGPEILARYRRGLILRHGIREPFERVEPVIGALDAEILAQEQEKKCAVANGDSALDDVTLDAPDLFELTQKVQTSIEAASRNAREKRRVVVVGGDRFLERVAALDLQTERRESALDQMFDHNVLSSNSRALRHNLVPHLRIAGS